MQTDRAAGGARASPPKPIREVMAFAGVAPMMEDFLRFLDDMEQAIEVNYQDARCDADVRQTFEDLILDCQFGSPVHTLTFLQTLDNRETGKKSSSPALPCRPPSCSATPWPSG